MRTASLLLMLTVLGGCGCRQPEPPAAPASEASPTADGFTLTSSAFANGQAMPAKYTADGAGLSPPLSWGKPPVGTVELALVCEDTDAPGGAFGHWVVWGLPLSMRSLPEGVGATATGLTQGRNDFGQTGYGGPAPPAGQVHHYHFRLLALEAPVGLAPDADLRALQRAVADNVIAEAELVGTYERERRAEETGPLPGAGQP